MNIRHYRAGDAPALTEIYIRSVKGLGGTFYTPDQVRVWAALAPQADRLDALMEDGRIRIIAENGDGEPVAFADLEAGGHIHFLYCLPEVAGKGVTAQLYESLEKIARDRGIDRLYSEASELALRFFEKHGFSMIERRDFEVDGVPIHNYAVEKRLS